MHFKLSLIFCFLSIATFAQKENNDGKDYHNNPYWIQMMDDDSTNYLEAIRAFEIYWQGRELPTQSETEAYPINNKLDSEEHEGLAFKNQETYAMVYAYKRFMHWKMEHAPYADMTTGRIMNRDERLNLWRKQHENR